MNARHTVPQSNPWSTLSQIRAKCMARWESGQLLAEALVPRGLFPQRIPLKHPSPHDLNSKFTQAQIWVHELRSIPLATGLSLEWRDINHRQLGRNQLPVALHIQSAEEAIAWLGKTKKLQQFLELAAQLVTIFPKLEPWVLKKPHQLIEQADNLPHLITILEWITKHPRPNKYLRQLSLPGIDTKFIEQHKKLLSEWFDMHLPAETITAHHSFALRYGFLDKPELIRFRILDSSLYLHGLSDLTITTTAFSCLNLPLETLFVTENDINALAFPDHPKSIVLFGRGYGFDFLLNSHWLKDKQIKYWGDIDTHGLAILNQFRQYLPQTESFLMNEETLLTHKPHWTTEHKPNRSLLKHLHPEEAALYAALQENHFGEGIRLEQEYINYDVLKGVLSSLAT
ncbi:MAG: Wadjet anti-phage system protein JetD domain-containing protein [Legionellales bacterium]